MLTKFLRYTDSVFCPYYHKIRDNAIFRALILIVFVIFKASEFCYIYVMNLKNTGSV